jgi:peptide/nickel transport system permease protein
LIKFALRRIALGIMIMVGSSVLIYALILAAPGGPEQKFAENPKYTAEQKAGYLKSLGLDKPVPVQYCRWLGACRRDKDGLDALIGPTGLPVFLPTPLSGINTGILHGELGYSYANGEGVGDSIAQAALPTLILAGLSIVIWLTLAVILGVWTGLKSGSKFDNTVTTFTYVTSTFPTFILGFMLIWIFAVTLGWTPVSGMTDARQFPAFGSELYWQYFGLDPAAALIDLARHLILPVSTLVLISVAGDSRYVRASVIDSMSMEHVRTARAKGLPYRRVIIRHALRTALVPFATNLGLAFPFLCGGALITETIFSWPGVGRLTLLATNGLDYPMLMAILLIASLMVVIGNLISDLLYAILDPRVRL